MSILLCLDECTIFSKKAESDEWVISTGNILSSIRAITVENVDKLKILRPLWVTGES